MSVRKKSPSEPTADPWVRQPAESSEAHSAFLAYRDAGPDRSLESVSHSLNKSCTILGRWSARHGWVERVRAWENHLNEERDRVFIQEARKWARRRQQELEDTWGLVQAIRVKLKAMLAWPISRQRTEKDGKTIIFEPAKWTYQSVALLAKTSAEIGAATLMAAGHDPNDFTEAQLRLIIDDPLEAGEADAS
jgi:hypothetical protein